MTLLDVLTTPLEGTVLVEANAGTGKTWAITSLYLRLLAEREEFTVDRILAVTFTEAATVDLRSRTRWRLDEARAALRAGESDDPFLGPWIASLPVPREDALARVENALHCFDQAAIHTIHAFCRRLLADLAFQCGVAFETETASDETDLMQEVVDDSWRELAAGAEPCLVEWLARKKVTPDSIRDAVARFVHKEYLGPDRIDVIPGKPNLPGLSAAFAKAHEDARAAWTAIVDPRATLAAMLRGGAINGNQYTVETVRRGIDLAFELLDPGLDSAAAFARLLDDDDLKDLGRLDQRAIDAAENRNKTAPVHPFFSAVGALLDARGPLAEGTAAAATHLRHELIFRLRRELPRRKEARRVISFDDLLLDVWHALAGERSTVLLDEARKRYGVALVDEFQDTDPVQWEIFRKIFAEGRLPLFLVGDPKQAIYSFRGADVFSYVDARENADPQFRLTDNRRSAHGLVTAVNTIFGGANPFMLESGGQELIPYRPSGSAGKQAIALGAPEHEHPLRLWDLCETSTVADMETKSVHATAGEIVRLLREARGGRVRVVEQSAEGTKERALKARDMAVLVRANRHGTQVRRALEKLGVTAAQHSQDNVFDTDTATDLHLLLSAIIDPADTGLMAAALATGTMNGEGRRLAELRRGEALAGKVERFREYRREWGGHGFLPMFRRLLREEGVAIRMLAFAGGERRLTDLLHLGELLHQAAHDEALGPEALLLWFGRRLGEEDARGDASLLRLESDDDLVQIVTVHSAKGLQYPVVFVPFAWHARTERRPKEDLLVHDAAPPHDARLAMGVPGGTADPNRARAGAESLAEDVRLLYVALTRAQCRCYVAWGRAGKAGNGNSPLARLLWRTETQDRTRDRERLNAWASDSGGSIAILEPPAMQPRLEKEECPTDRWAARRFARSRLAPAWRHASYSGLTAGAHASRDDDAPDHDEAAPVPAEPPAGDTLPAGAEIGTCLHTIFERWDPDTPETLLPITERALGGAGIEPKHVRDAVDLVVRTVRTPLFDGGPTLEMVPKARRLEEMEFWFPVASLDPARLKRALDAGHLRPSFRAQVGRLDFKAVHGFMKGFVDLVFEHAGKWYVCDYKSNRLADYTPERIDETMARSLYFVQYLLYTVALHRYLRLRLPGYDYDTHVGGTAYLFLRGMRPGQPGSGVFRDRPARELVEALDACMGETP